MILLRIVKKVTHHHIHHVIAHKGVVKSKYAAEGNNGLDFDNKDNDNKNANHLNYKAFKEEIGLKGDLNDDGFRSSFSKRVTTPVSPTPEESFGDLLATSSVQMRQPIRGYIGGQRAEFL